MNKHTPGPWTVIAVDGICEEGGDEFNVENSDGETVATISGSESEEQAEATARLIAAAPELLAALELIVTEAWAPAKPYSSNSYLPEHFIDIARSAIAKAKGQS